MHRCGAADLDSSLVVGVSGGPDSVALLVLLKAWCDQHLKHGALHAVTVDHALRPAAATEARSVGELCRSLRVPHATHRLEWAAPPLRSHIQEVARQRRYDALAIACSARSARALFIAHTLQDHAETVLLRWARASGLAGLGGMRPAAPLAGGGAVTLYRPLLGIPKRRLEATCAARGVAYVVDPSNADLRYDRVRIRSVAGGLERAAAARWPTARWSALGPTYDEGSILVAATAHLQRLAMDRNAQGA